MTEVVQVEEVKLSQFNDTNKLIKLVEVENILKQNGVNFNITNLEIYQQAFVHKSYSKKKDGSDEVSEKPEGILDIQENSNERLEYIGDAVISSVCAKYLYDRFPNQDEGFLTRIRTKIVNGESLADLARKLAFSEFLIISKHVEEKSNGRDNMRILEDAFESFFGALLLDFNETSFEKMNFPDELNIGKIKKQINEAKELKNNVLKQLKNNSCKAIIENLYSLVNNLEQVIENFENTRDNFYSELFSGPGYHVAELLFINIIEKYIYWPDIILKDTNYKDQLLRYYQHHYQTTPKYQTDSIEGPSNKRMFTMSVLSVDGNILGTGRERSKKKAEQLASKEALQKLNVIEEERYLED